MFPPPPFSTLRSFRRLQKCLPPFRGLEDLLRRPHPRMVPPPSYDNEASHIYLFTREKPSTLSFFMNPIQCAVDFFRAKRSFIIYEMGWYLTGGTEQILEPAKGGGEHFWRRRKGGAKSFSRKVSKKGGEKKST